MARDYRYNTIVNIEPFIMQKFPQQEERFSMIIVSNAVSGSDEWNITRNLLQYLVNSFGDEIMVPPTSDLSDIEKRLASRYTSADELKRQLAVIDISSDGRFKKMGFQSSGGPVDQISCINPDTPEWLKNQQIKNIINPNMIVQYVEGCENNFSHTIWLTDSAENLPQVLVTNSQYLFILDNENVNQFMLKRYKNDFKPHDKEEIIVIGMTITKDMKICTLNKNKFK